MGTQVSFGNSGCVQAAGRDGKKRSHPAQRGSENKQALDLSSVLKSRLVFNGPSSSNTEGFRKGAFKIRAIHLQLARSDIHTTVPLRPVTEGLKVLG
jgi:hypothetical protein